MDNIIGSLVTGMLALVGVIITNMRANKDIENKLATAQAVTDVKIENLTEEVRKHNGFGNRITYVESKVQEHDSRFERMDAKIEHLRAYHETK